MNILFDTILERIYRGKILYSRKTIFFLYTMPCGSKRSSVLYHFDAVKFFFLFFFSQSTWLTLTKSGTLIWVFRGFQFRHATFARWSFDIKTVTNALVRISLRFHFKWTIASEEKKKQNDKISNCSVCRSCMHIGRSTTSTRTKNCSWVQRKWWQWQFPIHVSTYIPSWNVPFSSIEYEVTITLFVNSSLIFRYELDNGQIFSEQGALKDDGKTQVVSGAYSFVGPDGQTYWVTFTADEFGYHPVIGKLS